MMTACVVECAAPICAATKAPVPISTYLYCQANTTAQQFVATGLTTSPVCASAMITLLELIAADASMATMEVTAVKQ